MNFKKTILLYFVVAYSLFFIPFTAFSEKLNTNDASIEETETGFYYTVKEGDTLWDLSQRFMDTPWVWPDLWNENCSTLNFASIEIMQSLIRIFQCVINCR